jgi:hypothetical protein
MTPTRSTNGPPARWAEGLHSEDARPDSGGEYPCHNAVRLSEPPRSLPKKGDPRVTE